MTLGLLHHQLRIRARVKSLDGGEDREGLRGPPFVLGTPQKTPKCRYSIGLRIGWLVVCFSPTADGAQRANNRLVTNPTYCNVAILSVTTNRGCCHLSPVLALPLLFNSVMVMLLTLIVQQSYNSTEGWSFRCGSVKKNPDLRRIELTTSVLVGMRGYDCTINTTRGR